MEQIYITLSGRGESLLDERKSTFLGYAMPVDNEQQAIDFINEIRHKHADARHNVYAYVIDKNNIVRYSDDGEPQGTAGIPVLEVLRKNGIKNAVIVVTRYFGGILLGTGGLVRAYSACAKLAVDDAGILELEPFEQLCFGVDYSLYQKVQYEMDKFDLIVDEVTFLEKVNVRLAIKAEQADRFCERIREFSAGRVEVLRDGVRFDCLKK